MRIDFFLVSRADDPQMGTPAYVGVLCRDGRVRYILVQYDGYLSGLGSVLKTHFTTYGRVRQLVLGGHRRAVDKSGDVDLHNFRGKALHDRAWTYEDYACVDGVDYVYLFEPEYGTASYEWEPDECAKDADLETDAQFATFTDVDHTRGVWSVITKNEFVPWV